MHYSSIFPEYIYIPYLPYYKKIKEKMPLFLGRYITRQKYLFIETYRIFHNLLNNNKDTFANELYTEFFRIDY